MEELNREQLLKNISNLAKRKGIKIGELEAEVGVSTGYFSRLKRDEGKALPGIAVLYNVAACLGVTVDDLISLDFSSLTATQSYLLAVVEKMIKDTELDKVWWEIETPNQLGEGNLYPAEYDNPLMSYGEYLRRDEAGDVVTVRGTYFDSHTYGNETKLVGPCFSLRLKNGVKCYLMCVADAGNIASEELNVKELWLYDPQSGRQYVGFNVLDSAPLSRPIANLCHAVVASVNRPRLRVSMRQSLDAFLNDDLKDDEIECPF